MPFLCVDNSHIAINHFFNGTLVLSNIVPVLTLKYLPVFLQRYLLFLHLYTFEELSNGDIALSPPPHLNSSKCSMQDCSVLNAFCSFNMVLKYLTAVKTFYLLASYIILSEYDLSRDILFLFGILLVWCKDVYNYQYLIYFYSKKLLQSKYFTCKLTVLKQPL